MFAGRILKLSWVSAMIVIFNQGFQRRRIFKMFERIVKNWKAMNSRYFWLFFVHTAYSNFNECIKKLIKT